MLDRKQVRHVARLARLSLTLAEEEQFAAQLSAVLGYVERLGGIDVTGVEPLQFAGDQTAAEGLSSLRADEAVTGLGRERALQAAPAHDGTAFLVPRIVE